jgi:hypothetical protein
MLRRTTKRKTSRRKTSKTSRPSSRRKTSRTKVSRDWEILIRAVNGDALTYIAALKGVYPQAGANWVPGIYAHYLSSEMDPQLLKNSCMRYGLGKFILVFHPDVLKDLPFVICNANMQGRCIDPTLDETTQKELRLIESPGNLESIPDMSVVSNWVNKYLDPKNEEANTYITHTNNRLSPKWIKLNKLLNKWLGERTTKTKKPFVISHEVIFKMVPLKYIVHILTWDKKTIDSVKVYFPKIPVTLIEDPRQYDDDDKEDFYCRDHFLPVLKKIYHNLKPLSKSKKRSGNE